MLNPNFRHSWKGSWSIKKVILRRPTGHCWIHWRHGRTLVMEMGWVSTHVHVKICNFYLLFLGSLSAAKTKTASGNALSLLLTKGMKGMSQSVELSSPMTIMAAAYLFGWRHMGQPVEQCYNHKTDSMCCDLMVMKIIKIRKVLQQPSIIQSVTEQQFSETLPSNIADLDDGYVDCEFLGILIALLIKIGLAENRWQYQNFFYYCDSIHEQHIIALPLNVPIR